MAAKCSCNRACSESLSVSEPFFWELSEELAAALLPARRSARYSIFLEFLATERLPRRAFMEVVMVVVFGAHPGRFSSSSSSSSILMTPKLLISSILSANRFSFSRRRSAFSSLVSLCLRRRTGVREREREREREWRRRGLSSREPARVSISLGEGSSGLEGVASSSFFLTLPLVFFSFSGVLASASFFLPLPSTRNVCFFLHWRSFSGFLFGGFCNRLFDIFFHGFLYYLFGSRLHPLSFYFKVRIFAFRDFHVLFIHWFGSRLFRNRERYWCWCLLHPLSLYFFKVRIFSSRFWGRRVRLDNFTFHLGRHVGYSESNKNAR